MNSVEYTIEVKPPRAILGESITAILACRATVHLTQALTFSHRSLVLEIYRQGSDEPGLAFPNRFAIEDGERLVRMSLPGGVEELQEGEKRERCFDLLPLFPDLVLAPGTIHFTYRVEEADPVQRPAPVAVEIGSGPAAVPLLIDLLASDSAAIRFRAVGLLKTMTAKDFGYLADGDLAGREEAMKQWLGWWKETGKQLPWNFQSSGATFGQIPQPAPVTGHSRHLGGIAYRQPDSSPCVPRS